MGFACWLCGYVVYTDDGFNAMSKKACPECGVGLAFVPLSDEVQLEDEAKTTMGNLDKETGGLFTRRHKPKQ